MRIIFVILVSFMFICAVVFLSVNPVQANRNNFEMNVANLGNGQRFDFVMAIIAAQHSIAFPTLSQPHIAVVIAREVMPANVRKRTCSIEMLLLFLCEKWVKFNYMDCKKIQFFLFF